MTTKVLVLVEGDGVKLAERIATRLNVYQFSEGVERIDIEGLDGVTRDSILRDTIGLSQTVSLQNKALVLPITPSEAMKLWTLLDAATSYNEEGNDELLWVRDRLARITAERGLTR